MPLLRTLLLSFLPFLLNAAGSAQVGSASTPLPGPTSPQLEVNQVSDLLGLTDSVRQLKSLRAQAGCGLVAASPEELTLRQFLSESVQAASLDLDGAMGTIANERGELANLQTSLKASRDKTVAKLNATALITGSGIGAAVSATQFTTLREQNQQRRGRHRHRLRSGLHPARLSGCSKAAWSRGNGWECSQHVGSSV